MNSEELRQEFLIEQKMREDLEFAIEQLGILDDIEALQTKLNNLALLGHQLTLKELLDEI